MFHTFLNTHIELQTEYFRKTKFNSIKVDKYFTDDEQNWIIGVQDRLVCQYISYITYIGK